MNAKDAYTLLEMLMDGVNPVTGKALPKDHVCHEPAVLRALHKAIVLLRKSYDAPDKVPSISTMTFPLDGEYSLSMDDIDRLKRLKAADVSVKDMCYLLQRKEPIIRSWIDALQQVDDLTKRMKAGS